LETKEQVLIVGAGIFGLTAAIVLGEAGFKVTVVEKEQDIMLGATLVNQNRIHLGYHYPRSKATCLESLAGLQTFREFYGAAIHNGFKKYYAIAKQGSHLDASQFHAFCDGLGLSLQEAWPDKNLLDHDMVEACWLTDEPVFDYYMLKQLVTYRLSNNRNITVLRNVQPSGVSENAAGQKQVLLSDKTVITCDTIVNATYAGISETAHVFGKAPIAAKYQLCLMPILTAAQPPEESFGVTVMDGPFCSLMPRGLSKEQFILYHVKHSVIETHVGERNIEWSAIKGFPELDIIEQSKAFFPVLNKMKIADSWITTRIVLPQQEVDDARPTFAIDHGDRIYSLFSGKLTTCVSAAKDLLLKISQ
jgi:hypothetical protein